MDLATRPAALEYAPHRLGLFRLRIEGLGASPQEHLLLELRLAPRHPLLLLHLLPQPLERPLLPEQRQLLQSFHPLL